MRLLSAAGRRSDLCMAWGGGKLGEQMRVSRPLVRVAWAILMLALTLAAGCNLPGLRPTPDMMATLAAMTVTAHTATPQETGGPGSLITPAATAATPLGEAPTGSTQEPKATRTAQGACTNKLRFLRDVTVTDNTRIPAGEAFVKSWKVRNVGTCEWTEGYRLVFQSGHIMGGPPEGVPLSAPVPPGEDLELSVELVAPEVRGKYKGYWLLRDARGVEFGYGEDADEAFWVQIRAVPVATETATDEDDS